MPKLKATPDKFGTGSNKKVASVTMLIALPITGNAQNNTGKSRQTIIAINTSEITVKYLRIHV